MIVAGDLAQLPPVGGTQVFHSTIWYLFYPLFLCQPRRQQDDKLLYQILEEIRLGNISQSSWNEMTTNYTHQSPHYSHQHTSSDTVTQQIK